MSGPAPELLVYIGRFQPFHRGHLAMVRQALARAARVLVLVGSSNRSPGSRNPWSYAQRREMIQAALTPEEAGRVAIEPLPDRLYNVPQWIDLTRAAVARHAAPGQRVGIIGHDKDATTWYLSCFPDWDRLEIPRQGEIDSTPLRRRLLEEEPPTPPAQLAGALPEGVVAWLEAWQAREPERLAWLREESRQMAAYRAAWAKCPYAPTFVTVDAVVIQSGHLLTIRRARFPGQGLLALPGGFLDPEERLDAAVLRELREETGLVLTPADIHRREVFDHPDRSQRGRTLSHGYLFQPASGPLPPIQAGDDAARAGWTPLADFLARPEEIFEDHWFIVSRLLGHI